MTFINRYTLSFALAAFLLLMSWYSGYSYRDTKAISEAQAIKSALVTSKLQTSERLRIKEKYYQQLVTTADAEYQEKLENERKNAQVS